MDLFENSAIKQFFGHLVAELRTLVSKELDLAKAEMTEKAAASLKNVVTVTIGAAIGYAGLLLLLAGAVFGLANFISMWLSAIIVGAVVAGAGSVAALSALAKLKRMKLEPERTVASLREDKEWVKDQIEGMKQ